MVHTLIYWGYIGLIVTGGLIYLAILVCLSPIGWLFRSYSFDNDQFKALLFRRIAVLKVPLAQIERAVVVDNFAPSEYSIFAWHWPNRLTGRFVQLKRMRQGLPFLSCLMKPDIVVTPRDPDDFVRQFNELKYRNKDG